MKLRSDAKARLSAETLEEIAQKYNYSGSFNLDGHGHGSAVGQKSGWYLCQ